MLGNGSVHGTAVHAAIPCAFFLQTSGPPESPWKKNNKKTAIIRGRHRNNYSYISYKQCARAWQIPFLPSNLVHSILPGFKYCCHFVLHSLLFWMGSLTSRRTFSANPSGTVCPHPGIRHSVSSGISSLFAGSSTTFTFLFRLALLMSCYRKQMDWVGKKHLWIFILIIIWSNLHYTLM